MGKLRIYMGKLVRNLWRFHCACGQFGNYLGVVGGNARELWLATTPGSSPAHDFHYVDTAWTVVIVLAASGCLATLCRPLPHLAGRSPLRKEPRPNFSDPKSSSQGRRPADLVIEGH